MNFHSLFPILIQVLVKYLQKHSSEKEQAGFYPNLL